MYKFKFADIGEGLHEGTVGEIYVKVGGKVNEGDSLFSVETDKVTSDIPSPVTGDIKEILIKTGETVHVGDDIFHIDDGSTTTQETKPEVKVEEKPKEKKSETVSEGGASVVGSIKVSDAPMTTFKENTSSSSNSKKVFSTPYARKLASEKGIDINSISGSGKNGRVLAKDIENSNGSSSFQGAPLATASNLQPFSQPVTGMRKAIAKAMKNSWNNVAYTNLSTEVNMTKLWEQRKSLVSYTEKKYGTKVSFTALIALATIKALHDFPILNSKYDAANNVLKHDGVINLGIAVDTPKGLVVPVIKNANTKNIIEISNEIGILAVKARDGKLTMDDMSGGTFTLSNYGSAGAMFGIPVINYPEMGILGMGTIVDRVYAHASGDFYSGKVMYLSVAADHQWVDGADIGRFASAVKNLLENPILLLGGI